MKDAQWKGHGCTPSFTLHCGKCNKSYPYHTSHTWKKPSLLQATKETLKVLPVLFLVGMLLSGLTYHQVSDACFISNIQAGELLHYVDLNQLSKQAFHRDIIPTVESVVEELLEDLCRVSRSHTPDPHDVWVIVDTGWSHPGHWANESTTILCDGRTGLPLSVQHVIRGHNYNGSSQGKLINRLIIDIIHCRNGKVWQFSGAKVPPR